MYDFDIGKWVVKLMDTSHSYFTLLKFVNDKDAFSSHTDNLRIYTTSSDDNELIIQKDSIHKEYFTSEMKKNIEQAVESYSNQMLVILATYIETINLEFFETLFTKNNQLIFDYTTNNDEHNGYIKLNLLFDSNSKDEIIQKLILTSKNNAVNGSLKRVSERIFKLTKYQISKKLIDSIQSEIFDKRNSIVHESENHMIKKENIESYFQLTEKYLFELGKACKKIGAPYLDQANWLEKPNKNEETNSLP
ncbi:MAG: hypothetical protein GQ570_08000 [Helicobacteraceae bacterium]|nr:hypothetical protein [Helicobacteraceae bacterium]